MSDGFDTYSIQPSLPGPAGQEYPRKKDGSQHSDILQALPCFTPFFLDMPLALFMAAEADRDKVIRGRPSSSRHPDGR
jgi:hypothetical protein